MNPADILDQAAQAGPLFYFMTVAILGLVGAVVHLYRAKDRVQAQMHADVMAISRESIKAVEASNAVLNGHSDLLKMSLARHGGGG